MVNNLEIKSMKLYNHVDRIFNELREIGKDGSQSLLVQELSNFDQLHYYGTEAVDFAIKKLCINSNMSILEIGSGIGGPARHIANETGATVFALELQPDQNKLATELTERCGLTKKVIHLGGDFMTHDWQEKKFDAIVSWLTLYHILDHSILLQKCHDLLNPGGFFYVEDLISLQPFSELELSELLREVYGNHFSDYQAYRSEIEEVGFNLIACDDMSEKWTKFTRNRIESYNQQRARHLRVHGQDVVNSLIAFYSFIDRYFTNKKLGGIRAVAQKNSTS